MRVSDTMEPTAPDSKTPKSVSIDAPRAIDGAGSALRRAFDVPGALPTDIQALLKTLDDHVNRLAG